MPEFRDLVFPLRGIDRSMGFSDQREMTCCEGANVLGFEPALDRSRGGTRPGLERYIDDQLPLDDLDSTIAYPRLIQHLNVAVRGDVGAWPDFEFPASEYEDDPSSAGDPTTWGTEIISNDWDGNPMTAPDGGGGGGRNPGPRRRRKKGSGRPPSKNRIRFNPPNNVSYLYQCIGQVNISDPGGPFDGTNPSFAGCLCVGAIYLTFAGAPTSCQHFYNWWLALFTYLNEHHIGGTYTIISDSVTGPVRQCTTSDQATCETVTDGTDAIRRPPGPGPAG